MLNSETSAHQHPAASAPKVPLRQQWNLPNKLTMLRILATPVILVLLLFVQEGVDRPLTPRDQWFGGIAGILFILAAITDWLDGTIARKYNLITDLGKLLDPLADKMIVMGVMIMLVHLDRLHPLIAITLIVRDVAVNGLRSIAANQGLVIAASQSAKLKTVFTMTALIGLCIYDTYGWFPFGPAANIVIWIALALSLHSGYDYFAKYIKLLGAEK